MKFNFIIDIYTKDNVSQLSIDEIQDFITSEFLKDYTIGIRKSVYSKQVLPMFYPCFYGGLRSFNEESKPTGLIQFDVDIKSNRDVDIFELKRKISDIPAVKYAFISPNMGLKFAIKTDFAMHPGETPESVKARFRQGYAFGLEYVLNYVDFTDDDSCKSISQGCYFCWDPNAYFNPDAKALKLNDRCIYKPRSYISNVEEFNCDNKARFINDLLSSIYFGLNYRERLPINACVLNELGESGKELLLRHSHKSRNELAPQLDEQYKSLQDGNIQWLVNIAHKYMSLEEFEKLARESGSYISKAGRSRRSLKAQKCENVFDQPIEVEEATKRLDKIIGNCQSERKIAVVRISTGTGKSRSMINYVTGIPEDQKVLILLPTHELARQTYRELLDKMENESSDPFYLPSIKHIVGKERACEEPQRMLAPYKSAGESIPTAACFEECPQKAKCQYTKQFDAETRIRIMVHPELFNQPASFDRDTGWKPDLIVVDESCISVKTVSAKSGQFDSLDAIITACQAGKGLKDAVDEFGHIVFDDYSSLRYPKFSNTKQYLKDYKETRLRVDPTEILKQLYKYLTSGKDVEILRSVEFDKARCEIKFSYVNQIANRYRNTPILILDATAEKEIYERAFGPVEFHKIKVKSKDEINVYQLDNWACSKTEIANPKGLQRISDLIKQNVDLEKYTSIGLITYMYEKSKNRFDCALAQEVGAEIFDHFANIRGQNKFEGVDCLIIAGRHHPGDDAIEDYCRAIYGKGLPFEKKYIDVPIQMKNGDCYTVNNNVYLDPRVDKVYSLLVQNETVQAIGRGRLIHGAPKDIFYFSNLCLRDEVQISDFIHYEPKQEPKALKLIENIQKIGFCISKPGALKEFGASETLARADHIPKLEEELFAFGIVKYWALVKTKGRHDRDWSYYVYDYNKWISHFEEKGQKLLDHGISQSTDLAAE